MAPFLEWHPVLDDSFVQESGLRKWYSHISPRYIDLVSDFAGQEFFLLDGEALSQSVFDDPMHDPGGPSGGVSLCLLRI